MFSVIVLCFLFFNCLYGYPIFEREDVPVINTRYGEIIGTSDNITFNYFGIPYAAPPINELRWKAPMPIQPWRPEILNATSFKLQCPQPIHAPYAEDCLYLNVYVPISKNKVKIDTKKAVMIFIHGGSFSYGSPDAPVYNSSMIAAYGDVIVVTIAYRLGSLGFLVTGAASNQISGNFGILDQKLAIKWVFENIENFGGDQERITIFGQSAGGQSVSTHLLSPDIQPYLNNAIIQSAPSGWTYTTLEKAMSLSSRFTTLLNCTNGDLNCLYNKTTAELMYADGIIHLEKSSTKSPEVSETWNPFIDGIIIKGQLLEIEKWLTQNFTHKPFIIGTMSDEWLGNVYSVWPDYLSREDYSQVINDIFNEQASKVLNRYPPIAPDLRDSLGFVLTAWSMSCSARNYTEKYMYSSFGVNSYYLYDFDFPSGSTFPSNICVNHSCHGGDVPYTFDYQDEKFSYNGHQVSVQHISYWTNFAKYGTPNNNSDLVYWPKYDRINRNYLRFKIPPMEVNSSYLYQDCEFWDSIGYYYGQTKE